MRNEELRMKDCLFSFSILHSPFSIALKALWLSRLGHFLRYGHCEEDVITPCYLSKEKRGIWGQKVLLSEMTRCKVPRADLRGSCVNIIENRQAL